MTTIFLIGIVLVILSFFIGYLIGKSKGREEYRYDLHWINEKKRNQWHELDKSTRRKN